MLLEKGPRKTLGMSALWRLLTLIILSLLREIKKNVPLIHLDMSVRGLFWLVVALFLVARKSQYSGKKKKKKTD